MDVKTEINEMLDAMNRVSDDEILEFEDDPPPQKPDDSPPATNPPDKDVEDDDKAESPSTDPPKQEEKEDEVAKLRAKIIELESARDKTKKDEKPPATDPPIGEKDFLDGIDLDEIKDDRAAFNKLLNKIYSQAVTDTRGIVKQAKEETFNTLPTKVTEQLELKNTLQKMTEEFYKENTDLSNWKKTVSAVFNEVVQESPGLKIAEVLRKVGDETRERLGLPKPSKVQVKDTNKPKDDDAPPPLPRRKGSRVQNPSPAEPNSVKSQIDEMIKVVGRR